MSIATRIAHRPHMHAILSPAPEWSGLKPVTGSRMPSIYQVWRAYEDRPKMAADLASAFRADCVS